LHQNPAFSANTIDPFIRFALTHCLAGLLILWQFLCQEIGQFCQENSTRSISLNENLTLLIFALFLYRKSDLAQQAQLLCQCKILFFRENACLCVFLFFPSFRQRSEERRVGKECSSREDAYVCE